MLSQQAGVLHPSVSMSGSVRLCRRPNVSSFIESGGSFVRGQEMPIPIDANKYLRVYGYGATVSAIRWAIANLPFSYDGDSGKEHRSTPHRSFRAPSGHRLVQSRECFLQTPKRPEAASIFSIKGCMATCRLGAVPDANRARLFSSGNRLVCPFSCCRQHSFRV